MKLVYAHSLMASGVVTGCFVEHDISLGDLVLRVCHLWDDDGDVITGGEVVAPAVRGSLGLQHLETGTAA